MKKSLIIGLSALSLFALAGCESKKENTTKEITADLKLIEGKTLKFDTDKDLKVDLTLKMDDETVISSSNKSLKKTNVLTFTYDSKTKKILNIISNKMLETSKVIGQVTSIDGNVLKIKGEELEYELILPDKIEYNDQLEDREIKVGNNVKFKTYKLKKEENVYKANVIKLIVNKK